MKAVYIHIPFCHSICTYCDFCKVFYDKKIIRSYLEALADEIKKRYNGESIKTIYIGGGTPSVLDIDELTILFKILEIFKTDNLEEFTIEANVENVTKEKLLLFKQNGVNRLSIGVQSFTPKILNILGRNHTKKMVFDAIICAKEIGIPNINVDMMYGMSEGNIHDLKNDVAMLLKLDVTHISFYSLIIEPHTKLYIDSYKEIDEDLNAKMYDYINKTLIKNNYYHYEISNYAKKGYEAVHNLVYWHNEEYYGFGLGASSFINRCRFDNTKGLNNYLKGKYNLEGHILDDREMMENEMILGLRLTKGVNKDHFYHKYHQKIEDVFPIDKLIVNRLLIDKNNFLYIPPNKLFISNSILLTFLD